MAGPRWTWGTIGLMNALPVQLVGAWMLVAILVLVPFHFASEREVEAHLEKELLELQAALRGTDALLRTVTNQAFSDLIGRGELRARLARISESGAELRNSFPPEWVDDVGFEAYRGMRTCCGASLQILGADGTPLLRYGHRLIVLEANGYDTSPRLQDVLHTRLGAQGFQADALGLAYRRVLPVWNEGEPVGGIEAVLMPGALVTLLRRIGGDVLVYHLLVNRDALPDSFTSLSDNESGLRATALHPSLYESVEPAHPGSRLPHWLEESRTLRDSLELAMPGQAAVKALVEDTSGRRVAVVMEPLRDISGQVIGYAVSESSAGTLMAARSRLQVFATVTLLLAGGLVSVSLLMVRLRRGASDLREQIAAITESMGEGVYMLDGRGRVRYINQAACKILGYQQHEVLGARAHDLFHPRPRETASADELSSPRISRSDGIYRSDGERFRTRSGKIIPVSLTVTTLRGKRFGKRLVAVFQDISDRTRELSDLKRQAARDPLTGLANRRLFDVALEREIRRSRRALTPVSLLMLDVDEFKAYNDAYGHLAGDMALQRIAGVLRTCVSRSSDLVCRYGGEEFAVILPETDHDAARQVAERIRSAVEAESIPQPEGAGGEVLTVSIGYATASCSDIKPSALVRRADACLYRVKNLGRNRTDGVTIG